MRLLSPALAARAGVGGASPPLSCFSFASLRHLSFLSDMFEILGCSVSLASAPMRKEVLSGEVWLLLVSQRGSEKMCSWSGRLLGLETDRFSNLDLLCSFLRRCLRSSGLSSSVWWWTRSPPFSEQGFRFLLGFGSSVLFGVVVGLLLFSVVR